MGRFEALDGLRGVCAVGVVCFHLDILGAFTELPLFRNADMAVEFFFVLSGFVLCHTYGLREKLDLKRYLISRTFRLVPLHWAMLAAFIALEAFRATVLEGSGSGRESFTGPTAPAEFIPNLLLIQAWTPFTDPLSFNYPSWSLSVEYYLYMLLALLMGLSLKHRVLAWLAVAVAAFTAIYLGNEQAALRGLSCFFAGALSYLTYRRISEMKMHRTAWTIAEVLVVLGIAFAITSELEHKGIYTSALFCLAVVVLAFEGGAISWLLRTRALSLTGRLSYSIYLSHAIILSVLAGVFGIAEKLLSHNFFLEMDGRRFVDMGSEVGANMLAVGVLAVIFAASWFTYHQIEVRGQQLGKRILARLDSPEAYPLAGVK